MAELDRIFDELRAKNPRGLVIRSAKDSGFIAGADVEEFTRIKDADDAMRLVKRGWDLYNKLEALPFPTLALVNGFCMGGGVELALACRYRVAVDQPGTRFQGLAGSLSGALRDPRAMAEIRRRPVRAATRGPGVRHRASRGRYRAQPHPHLFSPGTPEIPSEGQRLQGTTRSRGRRGRH